MTVLDPKTAADAFEAHLARENLLDFATRMDPHYERARHIEYLAEYLEALERREIRRLAICLPPRHSKTELTRKFVAWYLGRHPRHQVIMASYGSELAEEGSRAVRDMLESEEYPFAGVGVRGDSRSVARWQTTQGGIVIAAGIGGPVTGRGADVLVADDLVKGAAEAHSELVRASTSAWFRTVLGTRLQPDPIVIMIGTRWHEDDVLGQVLDGPGSSEWTKCILPLVAEEDDPLGREPGAYLWPERQHPSRGNIPRVELGEISSREFAALYQQRPAPADGNIFKRSWFENRYAGGIPREMSGDPDLEPWADHVERACPTIVAVDCASKTGVANDFTAIVTIAIGRAHFYIVDVVRERLEFPALVRRIQECHERWHPSGIYIEEASAGIPVVQQLRGSSRLPVIGVPPSGSKEARADAVTAYFESGKVLLPQAAPWIDAYVEELTAFPVGKHDDMVDATALAISSALRSKIATRHSAQVHKMRGWFWRR